MFRFGKDKKVNQQAFPPDQDNAPGTNYSNSARQDSDLNGRSDYVYSQYDQSHFDDPQTRMQDESGKRERKHRFRKSKNRSHEENPSLPAEMHQAVSGPSYSRPPLTQQYSNNFSDANLLDHRAPVPDRVQNIAQVQQAPVNPFRGLWSWIPHVKQSAADATVIDNVKGLFVLAEQFVSNFYSARSYSGETPNSLLERINCSTSMSTSELQNCLMTANLHNPIITHVLISLLLNLIAFDSMESQDSLLPKEFQNFSTLAKAMTNSTAPESEENEMQPALSSYRVLSAFLRSGIKTDQNYLKERQQVIEKVMVKFERAFQHWVTNKRTRNDRYTVLRKVFENAADLGIFLFSQPAVYEFNWNKNPSDISDGCVAIWPRLLRACDNDARWKEYADHMIPIQLGLVIDKSAGNPGETRTADRGIGVVDATSSAGRGISRTTKPPNSHGDEDVVQKVDTTTSLHIKRKPVVVQKDDEEAADVSDEDVQSGHTWSTSPSDISEDESKAQDPFKTENDTPPDLQQATDMEAKSPNQLNVPDSLRIGSRDVQAHRKVTSHPEYQSPTYRAGDLQDSPLGSYESLEKHERTKSSRQGSSRQESADLNEQFSKSSELSSIEARQRLSNNRRYNIGSPQGSPVRANMAEGSKGPRSIESPSNSSPSRDAHQQIAPGTKRNEKARGSSRPNSAVFTAQTQPRAHTVDSYDFQPSFAPSQSNPDVQDIYQNSGRLDRPQTSLDHQVSSRYYQGKQYEARESGRPRASSNGPSRGDNRSRGEKKYYPPQAYNRQFNSSHPDRMTAAEDRQWESNQITPTPDDEYDRGRSKHGSSSRTRRRSSSLNSMKNFLKGMTGQ